MTPAAKGTGGGGGWGAGSTGGGGGGAAGARITGAAEGATTGPRGRERRGGGLRDGRVGGHDRGEHGARAARTRRDGCGSHRSRGDGGRVPRRPEDGAAGTGGATRDRTGRARRRAPDAAGKLTTGAPRQSFQASVARGGTGGLPWKLTSKTPRFTSLAAATRSSDVRTISSCVRGASRPTASVVPGRNEIDVLAVRQRQRVGRVLFALEDDLRRHVDGDVSARRTARARRGTAGAACDTARAAVAGAGVPTARGRRYGRCCGSAPTHRRRCRAAGAPTGPSSGAAGRRGRRSSRRVSAATRAGAGPIGSRARPPEARRTSYRRRDIGSTARQPSSSSSIEKPLIGADSPRCARAAWSAFCQDSASTKSDSLSLLPSEVTSTSQRTQKHLPGPRPKRSTRARAVGRAVVAPHSARSPSAGRSRAAYTAGRNREDDADEHRDDRRDDELHRVHRDRQARDEIHLRVEREGEGDEEPAAEPADEERRAPCPPGR